MAPDPKILGAISKEDLNDEIQRRLQDDEIQKSRRLLAMATGSHLSAIRISKDLITQQILTISKSNGNGRK